VFSRRVPADLAPNRIAAALAAAAPPFDLTASNPTACAIAYPERLLDALADRAGLAYRPDPRGLTSARRAAAAEYRRWGVEVDPEHVVLTASTSEAYAFLFKLLAEPGGAVLVPSPSYPLFEHLARLEGVDAIPYHLNPELGWRPDLDALTAAPAAVRAIVVVHPNNPTGSFVHPDDAAALERLAAARGWAVIADEVFLDYPLAGGAGSGRSFAASEHALTFALGGLSKSVGLPQLKLAWIAVGGPRPLVEAALARLEFIADTFLSVGTPVQLALPALLRDGAPVRAAILERCRANLAELQRAAVAVPEVSVLSPGGGWSAAVRVPAVVGEEELALELLEKDGVAVHPGYFFDFPSAGTLVLSLLPEPAAFAEGVRRVLARVRAHLAW
jgi:aspartate/methionine/tyrosine aminotransferase